MRARYAGTCSRTGKSYPAGTEIEKYGRGWAIAGAGAISEPVYVRVDGEIKRHDASRVEYCRCVKDQPGFDPKDQSTFSSECRVSRTGNDITCPKCGRTIHILTEDEAWTEVTLPDLYLENTGQGYYALSRKIGPAKWDLVKDYFTYWSADDLDEMDVFDHAGDWFLRPGKAPAGVILNSAPIADASTAEAVEEILGILPENRLAVREPRLQVEAAQAERRRQEKNALLNRLSAAFAREDGEYVQPAAGTRTVDVKGETIDHPRNPPTVYGGGSWFVLDDDGAHVWHVVNNGADGDDWSRNNVRTGGAGAIGLRFTLTPERLAILKEACPERMAEIEANRSGREAEKQLLSGFERANDLDTIGYKANKDALAWTVALRVGKVVYESAHHPTGRLIRRYELRADGSREPSAGVSTYADRSAFEAAVRAEIGSRIARTTAVAVAQAIVKDSLWTGDHDRVWQVAVDLEGIDHWVAIARSEPYRVNDERELPGGKYDMLKHGYRADLTSLGIDYALMQPVKAEEFGLTYSMGDMRGQGCRDDVSSYFREKLGLSQFHTAGLYRDPEGKLFARIAGLGGSPRDYWILSEQPGADWAAAGERANAKREAEAADRKLTALRKVLRKNEIVGADGITGQTIGKEIAHHSRPGSGTSETTLNQVTLHSPAGDTNMYRVMWVWGYMGEDGDAGEEIEYYDDLAAAKESYAKYASY